MYAAFLHFVRGGWSSRPLRAVSAYKETLLFINRSLVFRGLNLMQRKLLVLLSLLRFVNTKFQTLPTFFYPERCDTFDRALCFYEL